MRGENNHCLSGIGEINCPGEIKVIFRCETHTLLRWRYESIEEYLLRTDDPEDQTGPLFEILNKKAFLHDRIQEMLSLFREARKDQHKTGEILPFIKIPGRTTDDEMFRLNEEGLVRPKDGDAATTRWLKKQKKKQKRKKKFS